MVVKPGFELGFKKSKIVPCWDVWSCDGSFGKCHLIYPAKSQFGIVSKQILKKINNTIRSQSNFNTNLLFVVFHLCTVSTFILFLFYFLTLPIVLFTFNFFHASITSRLTNANARKNNIIYLPVVVSSA